VSFSIPLIPKSGKQNFAIRLANEFKRQGVKVVTRKPDVNLVFLKGLKKNCKNVFRLDGVLMNTRVNYLKKNKKIRKEMAHCDAVIYQNKFCKKAGDKFLGKMKRHAVILNGADPSLFNPEGFSHKKPFILAMCRWRPHKRLKTIVEGFLQSGLKDRYDLIVCGETDYTCKDPSVIYFGRVKTKKMQRIVASCEFTVHLAYIDWCPNSVVESLVAGRPVLHTDSGGTKYVVQESGICLKDRDWNFKPIDLYSPPELDMDELVEGYKQMAKMGFVERKDLYISSIAKQYLSFFNKIL